jgi:hypothetical protein
MIIYLTLSAIGLCFLSLAMLREVTRDPGYTDAMATGLFVLALVSATAACVGAAHMLPLQDIAAALVVLAFG